MRSLRARIYNHLLESRLKHLKQPVWLQTFHAVNACIISVLFGIMLITSRLSHVWYKTMPIPDAKLINDYLTVCLLIFFWALVLKHTSETPFHRGKAALRMIHRALWIALSCLLLINITRIAVWWFSWA